MLFDIDSLASFVRCRNALERAETELLLITRVFSSRSLPRREVSSTRLSFRMRACSSRSCSTPSRLDSRLPPALRTRSCGRGGSEASDASWLSFSESQVRERQGARPCGDVSMSTTIWVKNEKVYIVKDVKDTSSVNYQMPCKMQIRSGGGAKRRASTLERAFPFRLSLLSCVQAVSPGNETMPLLLSSRLRRLDRLAALVSAPIASSVRIILDLVVAQSVSYTV